MGTKKRNPKGIHYLDKARGNVIKGTLWKKKFEGRFIMGNQIISDCYGWKQENDSESGQWRMPHEYAYRLWYFLLMDQLLNNKGWNAVHLWCDKKIPNPFWSGIR